MDPEIKELKELVRRSIALSEDTNRTVHSMRNGARWARLFKILWWILLLAASAYAYYYYVLPHMLQLLQMLQKVQAGGQQAQQAGQQLSSFFTNLLPHFGTTTGQ